MICVDILRGNGARVHTCHLFSLLNDFAELDRFAQSIGLDRQHRHRDHYDLHPTYRARAIAAGAAEIADRDPRFMAWLRGRGNTKALDALTIASNAAGQPTRAAGSDAPAVLASPTGEKP